MTSSTQRTLAKLRAEGYLVAVVERWNPHARVRQDLYGIIDVLAVRDGETLAVQACTSRVSERVGKIAEHESTPWLRAAGWRIEVWGWTKRANGRYALRVVDLS